MSAVLNRNPTTDKELQGLGEHWQVALRLRDWDVKFKFARHYEFNRPLNDECEFYEYKRRALIRIRHPGDRDESETAMAEEPVENTVVHDVLHLHSWGLYYKTKTTEGQVKSR
jgi:hypothetical protein